MALRLARSAIADHHHAVARQPFARDEAVDDAAKGSSSDEENFIEQGLATHVAEGLDAAVR